MKKIIAIVLACAGLFAFSTASMAEEILYYDFESSDGLSAVTNTLVDGGEIVTEEGFIGNSLSLNGTYGLKLGDVTNTFSVSAMVKLTSAGETGTIFFKNMGTSSSQKWTGVLSRSGVPAFWTHGDGFGWSTVASGNEASLGSWAQVVYIENAGVGSLYVNGELVGSGSVVNASGSLYLGATYWSADAPSGLVDNVRLYDSVLTEDEIKAEYESYISYLLNVPAEVISDIDLPQSIGSKTIVWSSSDESIITSDGKVTRGTEDQTVTLTATVDENQFEFVVKVLKMPAIVNDEVILSYTFSDKDDTIIYDASGNENHGMAYNNLQITDEGARFDGMDDYVQMGEGVLHGHDSVTFIMKLKTEGAQKNVFAYTFGNSSSTGYIFMNPSRPATNAVRFAATHGSYDTEKAVESVPGIRNGEWATVVVTVDGTAATMYIDGEAVMDADLGMTISDLGATAQNYIAKSLYDGDPYFAGTISEFTVLNYCISAEDIKNKYAKTPEYAPENMEYIKEVSFGEKIDVIFDDHGRDDVNIAAAVIDENFNVIEFSVAKTSDKLVITQKGTLVVFAFDEENNVPGQVFVNFENDSVSYEYSNDTLEVLSKEAAYKNGTAIAVGYNSEGALAGVDMQVCDIEAGASVTFTGDFDDAVIFKLFYWDSINSMRPIK